MKYLKHLFIAVICIFSIQINALAKINDTPSKKVALVIGNSRYSNVEFLPNPVNDAKSVSQQLKHLGFEVVEGIDLSKRKMKALLRAFSDKLDNNSIALFYYAGHGIQRNKQNYLVPVDADFEEAFEIEDASIKLDMVLTAIKNKRPRLGIALLDACRNNPFEKRIHDKNPTRSGVFRGLGLASAENFSGMILSYATEPGNVAVDGNEEHSPYTEALLKFLAEPGLSIQDMLNKVGLSVKETTNGAQTPWISSSPIPKFCFAGCLSFNENPLATEFSQAMGQRNLHTIKKLVNLNEEKEKLLKEIFSRYLEFTLFTLVPTPPNNAKMPSEIKVTIREAINKLGNRVLPSEDWRHLSFEVKAPATP